MRRNIYLRLLCSIVALTIAVLAIQAVMLLATTRIIERTWKERVFDDYVATLSQTFNENGTMTFADMLYILVDSAPDRISGLLIRDEVGDISISIGASSRGDFIPQPRGGGQLLDIYNASSVAIPKAFSVSVNTTEDYVTESVDPPEYRLELSSRNVGGTLVVDSISIRETGLSGKEEIKIPSVIQNNDIAGSIVLYNNGNIYGYVDILVFDIDVYGPTEMLLRDMGANIVIFLPIAVIISLVAGYFISKRNVRMIREIRRSLRELALGNYKVKVDKSLVSYDDFEVIAESIEALGDDLDRHRMSRKEWLKNISHDLNTPVTSMNLLLSGAEDGVFPVNDALIKKVKSENDILAERIASVAFYSNLLSYKPNMREIDIYDLIASALTEDDCIVNASFGTVAVCADFELMKRAFKEILDNAREYGKKGEKILIGVKKEDGDAIISFKNIGHLPSPRPQFFEPWARGDESRHQGGSGLGLPIVHQIMEIHHGSVKIDEQGDFVVVELRVKCL